MTVFDEGDLYVGLAAEHWRAAATDDPRRDQDFYRRIIVEQGGPALELGCGSGRLLLAYLAEGLDVAGTDISGDMLAVCRSDAAAAGLVAQVVEQPMQELELRGRFATIYIPCGSFVCVMDRGAAVETLRRCRRHLAPGGVLVFIVHLVPYDYSPGFAPRTPQPDWTQVAVQDLGGGRRLAVSRRDTGSDPIEQIWTEERRYELFDGDELVRTERHFGQGRWYFRNELLCMLELAGFTDVTVTGDFTDNPYGPEHQVGMMFRARRPTA